MRRVLFVAVLVAMLLGIGSVAFADEPKTEGLPPTVYTYSAAQLGDVWWFFVPGYYPGERVDACMYRPATAAWSVLNQQWVSLGWPLYAWDPVLLDVVPMGPKWGSWWWGKSTLIADVNAYMAPPEEPLVLGQTNASQFRRMNLTNEDEIFLFADNWGYYYAEFMFSRDEVWFPCSVPLKWKCNFFADAFTYVEHSPYLMTYECLGVECLMWPSWMTERMDTVSPLEVHIQGELYDWGSAYHIFPFEVLGYIWKFQDIDF
jgi:hypothetical protein